jgi:hypothetical protein
VPEVARLALQSVPMDQALKGVDLAVIVTAHSGVDHEAVARRVPATLDLRGVTRALELERIRLL